MTHYVEHYATIEQAPANGWRAVLVINGEPFLHTVANLSQSAAEAEARKWADDEGVCYLSPFPLGVVVPVEPAPEYTADDAFEYERRMQHNDGFKSRHRHP